MPRFSPAAVFWSAATGGLAIVTGVFLLLFLISSVFGGFRLHTPLGLVSCRHAGRLLLGSVAGALAWTVASWRRQRRPPRAPFIGPQGLTVLIGVISLLLWLRFLYRAHEPGFGGRPVPTVPLVNIHWLFFFSTLAALGTWRRLESTEGVEAASFAALATAASPLWFHVSTPIVVGYAALAVLWWGAPIYCRFVPPGVRRWNVDWASLGVPLALTAGQHWGWAGKRLIEQIVTRTMPGLTAWLLVIGLVGWWATRRAARPWLRPVLIFLAWGLVLGGARGEAGVVGALLLLAGGVGLAAVGLGWLLTGTPLGRGMLGHNVIMVALLGIFLGLVRDGVDRSIRSPFVPEEPASAAPATAPEIMEVAPE